MSISFFIKQFSKIRRHFGNLSGKEVLELPNLVEAQKSSYDKFLQIDISPEKREKSGLEMILSNIFSVEVASKNISLEYVRYRIGSCKYDVNESIERDVHYAAPLFVVLRLIQFDNEKGDAGPKEIKNIKEGELYVGDIPLITDTGTFVINGARRVVISQLHRSPGVFYFHDEGKSNVSGAYMFGAIIIPSKGSWLSFEFDSKKLIYFRIDKKRKLPVTTLFRAIGATTEDILFNFYEEEVCKREGDFWMVDFFISRFKGLKIPFDVYSYEDGSIVINEGARIVPRLINLFADKRCYYKVSSSFFIGRYLSKALVDKSNKEFAPIASQLTENQVSLIDSDNSINEIKLLWIDGVNIGSYIRDTLVIDKNMTKEEALLDIYRVMKPSENTSPEVAERFLDSLFFTNSNYDLSPIGRIKLNAKHDTKVAPEITHLTKEDIFVCVKFLNRLADGVGSVDDQDHLGNRRVRAVGELIEAQFNMNYGKIQKSIFERMSNIDFDSCTLHELFTPKIVMSVMNEFFCLSSLSQFMDQTNPVAEIESKRRISALGTGGLKRENAPVQVRDVHPTHYSRICPITTPEGANIGLINATALYARINDYGFIEAPYRKVINGKVTDEYVYLNADEEFKNTIAQSTSILDDDLNLVGPLVDCRKGGDYVVVSPADVDYMDITPKQIVSVGASLIPFEEKDDAVRALMGANMAKQAVVPVIPKSPIVGTGMERIVGLDSDNAIVSKNDGVVESVDSQYITIRVEGSSKLIDIDVYKLQKYQRTNQNTLINQKPLVRVGDIVKKGDVIADGSSTEVGDLGIGRDIVVAFMTFDGGNFEDSILVSNRIVNQFESIHIEKFECVARDTGTHLGHEQITRDIPNVSEEAIRNLDESGIINVGAYVKPGDILVGKVTPKAESPMMPEEKLFKAMFGSSSSSVRDSSLYVPIGNEGTVIAVRIFTRPGVEKGDKALSYERDEVRKISLLCERRINIISSFVNEELKKIILNRKTKTGEVITESLLSKYNTDKWWSIAELSDNELKEVNELKDFFDESCSSIKNEINLKIKDIVNSDTVPDGALKVIKIYIARKLPLQAGDKMAGRHGNKGVVSKVLPVEDMPYMDDGTPIDMILSPLGVPSRMNIGQIFEIHLGFASMVLCKMIKEMLEKIEEKMLRNEDIEEDVYIMRSKIIEIYGYEVKELELRNKCSESDSVKLIRDAIVKNNRKFNSDSVKKAILNMTDDHLIQFAKEISDGIKFATPVFDGATEKDIDYLLKLANAPLSGQVMLRDGRTGEYFDRPITVGYMYMMKLNHLVDNKIHARSTGPYSLITQQPLRGKSLCGGQRFGEMEVWALEAYGANAILRELMTCKSDDIQGRNDIYFAIVNGRLYSYAGEISTATTSSSIILLELAALCLDLEYHWDDESDSATNHLNKINDSIPVKNLSYENEFNFTSESKNNDIKVLDEDFSDSNNNKEEGKIPKGSKASKENKNSIESKDIDVIKKTKIKKIK